jgi:hypothetical protein
VVGCKQFFQWRIQKCLTFECSNRCPEIELNGMTNSCSNLLTVCFDLDLDTFLHHCSCERRFLVHLSQKPVPL